MEPENPRLLEAADFDRLIDAISAAGYRVIGPVLRDRTIVYDEVASSEDLPRGWTDEQEKGTYRVHRRDDDALFGYASALQAWKKYLRPPRRKLWEATRTAQGMAFEAPAPDPAPLAFLGVRSCDLHAIAIQDRVFAEGDHADARYMEARQRALIVAVNCTTAAATCFCTAMGTGPRVDGDADITMTEIIAGERHFFLVNGGSARGGEILEGLSLAPAGQAEVDLEAAAVQANAKRIDRGPRAIESADLQELLYRNYDNPQWDDVAGRCLSCANCTMVCPTCFCSTVEDVTDVGGDHAERWERWDSCFTQDFTHLHGGSVRQSTRSRYRQWMTHKLATWFDQFGTSGCVGCGRCIAWCPVGIDITEEVTAIRVREMNNG